MSPGNPTIGQMTRRGVLNRPDVYAELVRIEREGLQACSPEAACGPLWRCESCAVQDRLGTAVDAQKPSALAIAAALRREADLRDYLGADRAERIKTIPDEQFLTTQERARLVPSKQQELASQRRNRELALAYQATENEIASAAWEVLVMNQSQAHFTDEEARSLQQLHRWQATGGPAPLLLKKVERLGRELATHRCKRERGEIPRSRRISRTDRRRIPTGATASFTSQLGRLYDEPDPFEIERLVRELRRQARDLGLLEPTRNRRRRHHGHHHHQPPGAHIHRAELTTQTGRKLLRAARGSHREARELSGLRSCVELPESDPRRAAREHRFDQLAAKRRRRTAFLQPLLADLQAHG